MTQGSKEYEYASSQDGVEICVDVTVCCRSELSVDQIERNLGNSTLFDVLMESLEHALAQARGKE